MVQGSAAEVSKEALRAYCNHPERQGRPVHFIHDELMALVLEEHADEEARILTSAMESIELAVPLRAQARSGRTWADCKE